MNDQKKTVFVITSRFPFPLEKGDKLRAYHQIKVLSESYHVILCSVSADSIKSEWKLELEKYCSQVHVFNLNKLLRWWNTARMMFSSKPFQIGYFYQKKIKKKIAKIVEVESPDFIYCQLIRVAEYVKDIHAIPKTLDYMDALSAGMHKRAEISRGLFKVMVKMEGARLKVYENKIYDYFNHHTIISEQDKKLISHPNQSNICVIPNGVDEFFTKFDSSDVEKKYDLVFVGNLSYPPNVESCQFIVNEILQYFEQQGKSITVLLAGASPSNKVLKLNDHKNVTISGWVDDIRVSYAQGKVFVAPLFIGTGLQNKLLEAMSLNVPCVTTSLVNNALGAQHQKHVLVADNIKSFCKNIDILLSSDQRVKNMTQEAKQFIEEKYNWKSVTEKIPF